WLAPGQGALERTRARAAFRPGVAGRACGLPDRGRGPRSPPATRRAARQLSRPRAEFGSMNRAFLRTLPLALLLLAALPHAHDVRPGYLEITERPAGLNIVWKRPAAAQAGAAMTPRFSTGWTDGAPSTTNQSGEAVVRTWRVPKPHAPLAGTALKIDGLDVTI